MSDKPIIEENINKEIRIAILMCCLDETKNMDEIVTCVHTYNRLSGFSFNVIRRVIHALVTSGLLTANGSGKSRVFRTNIFGKNYLESVGISLDD